MPSAHALLDVIREGDAEKVEEMLLKEPSLARERGEEISPVMAAVYNGYPEIVDVLRRNGAQIDQFEAAATGDTDRLRSLLDADSTTTNGYALDGWTPLHLAAFFGQRAAADLLLSRGADMEAVSRNETAVTPLQSALANGAAGPAMSLLEHGANVNVGGASGWTPLHYAAANDLSELVETLLDHGADPHAKNKDGKTPLDLAREKAHTKVITLLAMATEA